MAKLEIFAQRSLLHAAVEAELAGVGLGAVVVNDKRIVWRDLVESAWASAPPQPRLGRLGMYLLADAVAAEAAGPLAALAGSPSLTAALMALIVACKPLDLGPAALAAAAPAGGPAVLELSRLFARYVACLGDRIDETEVLRSAVAWIGRGGPLGMLHDVDEVLVHEADTLAPGEIALIDALCARGITVRVRVPWAPDRPLLQNAVAPLLSALERRYHAPLDIELVSPVAQERPLAPLLERLFASAAQQSMFAPLPPNLPLRLIAAPSPEVEARTVARAIRDQLAAGTAPNEIAVVVRNPERRARLLFWFNRYGVPCHADLAACAAETPPIRLALSLYDLVDDDVPREAFIALISSRYVSGGLPGTSGTNPIAPHKIARALRRAGVRDGKLEDGVHGYRRRLEALIRAAGLRDRSALKRITEHVDRILAVLAVLPAQAMLARHAAALVEVLDVLQLAACARGFHEDHGGFSFGDHDPLGDLLGLARDQAAVAALERLLGELPRAAGRAGITARVMTRRQFAHLLGALLRDDRRLSGGIHRHGVALIAPEAACGHQFAQLFFVGLEDGEVPLRAPEDPVIGDEAAHGFNRALGADVLAVVSRCEAREPLVFLRALAAGDAATVSWSTADTTGRPLAGSAYADALVRAAGRPPERPGYDPVVAAWDARAPVELMAHVYLASEADATLRCSLPASPPAAHAAVTEIAAPPSWLVLAERLRAMVPSRDEHARRVIAIERARLDFFLRPSSPQAITAHPYVGRVAGVALKTLLPGGPHRPLSAASIEDYAQCGFRFLVRRVLRGEAPEETGDDLDALSGGRLYHRILERFFRTLVERGRWPLRGSAAEARLLDEVCDQVIAEWQAHQRTGHPALFAARVRRLRREIHDLVVAEQRLLDRLGPVAARIVPTWFEHAFELRIPPPPGGDPSPPTYIVGTIDRVDIEQDLEASPPTPLGAVVLDYKSGRYDTYRRKLRADELLVRSFQLPLYGAAVQSELGGVPVSAAYCSIRDAQRTPALDDQRVFALSPAATGSGNDHAPAVGERVWQLRRRMLAGDFTVAPQTCEHCELGAACRVVARALDEEP